MDTSLQAYTSRTIDPCCDHTGKLSCVTRTSELWLHHNDRFACFFNVASFFQWHVLVVRDSCVGCVSNFYANIWSLGKTEKLSHSVRNRESQRLSFQFLELELGCNKIGEVHEKILFFFSDHMGPSYCVKY